MLNKPIDKITQSDLENLVTAGVAEGRMIDYKQQMPEFSTEGKKELLADVSSFANTAGGDIIYGITETAGVAREVVGVQSADLDADLLRINSILQDGLEPRIRYRMRPVPLANGAHVLLIRSDQSWYGPHRVVFQGGSRFFGRHSNGKYEMDVTQLRNAFLNASTVTDKITAFRSERVNAIENRQTPLTLGTGPKIVVHCMPLESFGSGQQYDVQKLKNLDLKPIEDLRLEMVMAPRVNFEGLIRSDNEHYSLAYTQIYRNGVIEAVRGGLLGGDPAYATHGPPPEYFSALVLERALHSYFRYCLSLLVELGCGAPVLVGITLVGVLGRRPIINWPELDPCRPIDRAVLMLPNIVVDDLSAAPGPLLKPVLDLIWNTCGRDSSPFFDADGKWLGGN
jgi:hypothetical protein